MLLLLVTPSLVRSQEIAVDPVDPVLYPYDPLAPTESTTTFINEDLEEEPVKGECATCLEMQAMGENIACGKVCDDNDVTKPLLRGTTTYDPMNNYDGMVCYQFCEDGMRPMINRECPKGYTCTGYSGISFDSCGPTASTCQRTKVSTTTRFFFKQD